MTEENSEIPEFDFGQIDWSEMEHLANTGSVEGAPEPTAPQSLIITEEMLAKRILWDVAPCNLVPEVAELLELPGGSKDVQEMEHHQSHARMHDLAPIAMLLGEISGHITRSILAATIVANGVEDEVDEEEFAAQASRLYPAILQSNLTVLAELIDIGVLHFPVMLVNDDLEGSGE